MPSHFLGYRGSGSERKMGEAPKIQLLNDYKRISLKHLLCSDRVLLIYSLIIQKIDIGGNKAARKQGGPVPCTPSAIYPPVAIWNRQHRPGLGARRDRL